MLKRIIDYVIGAACFVILVPVALVVGVLLYIKQGPPLIYSQIRPGKDGMPFKIYKFNTMTEAKDGEGNLLPDADRMTPLGRYLRSTSLDELPELINVFKGEMSLVGPRPLLMQYLDRYSPEQARRHEVKPGITGWAQVNGRNELSWDEKFKLDVWYIDNWSIGLDIKILLRTIKKVTKREGISATGEATMPEFYPTNTQIGNREG